MQTLDTAAPGADPLAELRAAAAAAPGNLLPATDTAPAADAAGPTSAEAPAPAEASEAVVLVDDPAPTGPYFLDGTRRRQERVPLDWGIGYAGKSYLGIVIKRPGAAEVQEYFEHLATLPQTAAVFMPVFYHDDGEPVPSEVLQFMDADDDERVMKAAVGFLPSRLLELVKVPAEASPSTASADTEPKSSE